MIRAAGIWHFEVMFQVKLEAIKIIGAQEGLEKENFKMVFSKV